MSNMERKCEPFDQLEGKSFTFMEDTSSDVSSYTTSQPTTSAFYEPDEDQSEKPTTTASLTSSDAETVRGWKKQEFVGASSDSDCYLIRYQNLVENYRKFWASTPLSHGSRWDDEPTTTNEKSDTDADLEKWRTVVKDHRKLCSLTPILNYETSMVPYNIYPKGWENLPKYQPYPTSSMTPITEKKSPEASTSSSLESVEEIPCYKGHQLLGDSQMVRFSQQILGLGKLISTYTEDSYCGRIGYCISGQKIQDLKECIALRDLPLSDKLILLIGTNDMVQGTSLKSMCNDYRLILNNLKESAKRIVLVTVPPVPKLAHKDDHMTKLQEFNEFILRAADCEQVFVVDFASLLISYSNTVSTQYFEEMYGARSRSDPWARVDLIHLNRRGLKLLRTVLDIQYFDRYPLI